MERDVEMKTLKQERAADPEELLEALDTLCMMYTKSNGFQANVVANTVEVGQRIPLVLRHFIFGDLK